MAGMQIWRAGSAAMPAWTMARALHTSKDRLYIGASLPLLPDTPMAAPPDEVPGTARNLNYTKSKSLEDSLKDMPFGWLADFLGSRLWSWVEMARESELHKRLEATKMNHSVAEPPSVPHVLPITKWLSQNENVRSTLIVDEKSRTKPRLSWYHPDDTMVPRDWFSKGLLEDLKYYRPFMNKK